VFKFAAGAPIGAASSLQARVEGTILVLVAIKMCAGRPSSTRAVRRHDRGAVTRREKRASELPVWRLILSYLISSTVLPRRCDKVPCQQRRSMTASYAPDADGPSPHTVLLGEGTPTKEELLVYYPAKFTWRQLKTFVNSGYVYMLYL